MSYEASVAIITIGVLWLINLTAFGLDREKHVHIKMFLMMMSFFLMIPVLNVARQLSVDNSASSAVQNMLSITLGGVMFTVFIVAVYFFYSWIAELLRSLTKIRQERDGVKDEY